VDYSVAAVVVVVKIIGEVLEDLEDLVVEELVLARQGRGQEVLEQPTLAVVVVVDQELEAVMLALEAVEVLE
jgi:hypothetical protein